MKFICLDKENKIKFSVNSFGRSFYIKEFGTLYLTDNSKLEDEKEFEKNFSLVTNYNKLFKFNINRFNILNDENEKLLECQVAFSCCFSEKEKQTSFNYLESFHTCSIESYKRFPYTVLSKEGSNFLGRLAQFILNYCPEEGDKKYEDKVRSILDYYISRNKLYIMKRKQKNILIYYCLKIKNFDKLKTFFK